jgi:hypothetical protein
MFRDTRYLAVATHAQADNYERRVEAIIEKRFSQSP